MAKYTPNPDDIQQPTSEDPKPKKKALKAAKRQAKRIGKSSKKKQSVKAWAAHMEAYLKLHGDKS